MEVYIVCMSYWGCDGGGDTIHGVYSDYNLAKEKARFLAKQEGYTEESEDITTCNFEIYKKTYPEAMSGECVKVEPYWIDSDQYL